MKGHANSMNQLRFALVFGALLFPGCNACTEDVPVETKEVTTPQVSTIKTPAIPTKRPVFPPTAEGDWDDISRDTLLDLYASSWHEDWSGQVILHLKAGHYILSDDNPNSSDRKKRAFHLGAYDRESRIPLLVYVPGDENPTQHTEAADMQRVGATLFSLLNMEPPKGVTAKPLETPTKSQPKVIVVVVYDALPWSHWDGYLGQLPNHAKLRSLSQEYTQTRLGHMSSSTTVTHAVLGTGQPPKFTGIPINHTRTGVGTYDEIFIGEKPDRLLVPTAADLYDVQNDNLPIIASFCSQSRAAIAMAGHGTAHPGGDKDIVIWQKDRKKGLETNSAYWQLPDYLKKVSPKSMLAANPDMRFLGKKIKNERQIYYSYHNVFFGEQVLNSVMDNEPIGQDQYTDMIFINHKALDNIAHRHGVDRAPYQATMEGIDQFMGRFLANLHTRYGDDFVLIVTSDHGFGPTLARPKEGTEERRHNIFSLLRSMERRLGSKEVLEDVQYLNGYLNEDKRVAAGISLQQVCDAFTTEEWIIDCITRDEILARRASNSTVPQSTK